MDVGGRTGQGMNKTGNIIGKAKTVLIFGPDGATESHRLLDHRAACAAAPGASGWHCNGQVTFDHATLEHMSQKSWTG